MGFWGEIWFYLDFTYKSDNVIDSNEHDLYALLDNCCPTLIIIKLLKKIILQYGHRINNVIDA